MTELSAIMTERGMTSQSLSELTGIPKRTIEGYRSGSREPSLSAGLKISDALEIDPHDIVEKETDR